VSQSIIFSTGILQHFVDSYQKFSNSENYHQKGTNLSYNAVAINGKHNAGVSPVLFCLNLSNLATGGNAPEDNGVIFDEERTTA
jgi:hypothetical protein